ncbi:MAG: hypothetical protein HOE64_17180 [Nitrospina sp.]|nr:hypothetical protein [Nitrospina sp.]
MTKQVERDLVAQIDYPLAGISVDPSTGKARDPKKQGLLDAQNEPEEYEGLSPIAMGLLQAGASMMRNSGWRNTPMTTSEAIGYAIPEGLQGYYNQSAANQEEQNNLELRQQAEEDALIAKQEAEDKAKLARARATEFQAMLEESGLNLGAQRRYRSIYATNPLKAHELLDKRLEEKKEKDKYKDYKEVTLYNKETKEMEKYFVHKSGFDSETHPPYMIGPTGEISGLAKQEKEDEKFERTQGLVETKFGWTKEQAEIKQDNWERDFKRGANESGRDFGLRLKVHQDKLIQEGVANGFRTQEILNQTSQFRETTDLRKEHFDQNIDLKKVIFKEKTRQWTESFNEDAKRDERDFSQRLKEYEDKIIQDGIRNDINEIQIENQVKQFYESLGVKQDQFATSQDLRERTFAFQIEDSNKKFNQSVTQYKETKEFKELEGDRRQENSSRDYQQRVIEHLATIKQRGIKNNHSEQVINQAQERFLQGKTEFMETHQLAELKHKASMAYQAGTVAQRLLEFEYKQGRDVVGDKKDDKNYQFKLRQEEEKLLQQALGNKQNTRDYELKREIFLADVAHKKLKLATEGDQAPRTLTGQEAVAWANEQGENSPLNPNRQGTPVIKLNKHGQFDSIEYLSTNAYDESQLEFLTRSREKWSTDTEVKAANKITRLTTSLEALADDETGVSEFAMIYKFMKSLDETSTVLASEFRNAAGAGLGAFDRLMLWGDNQWTGKKLTEEQQDDILRAVRGVAYSRLEQMNNKQATYLADAVDNRKISKEDAEKMYPNNLATYFNNNPYVPNTGSNKITKKISKDPIGEAMLNGTYEDYLKNNPEFDTAKTVPE